MQQNLAFRVSDEARLKPVYSATETSKKSETWLVASLDMIFKKKKNKKGADQSASLLFANPEDRFSSVKAHILLYVFMSMHLEFVLLSVISL